MGNLVLGVTDTDVLVNVGDYVGSEQLNVFLPSGDTYRGHYRERALPSINLVLVGELPKGLEEVVFRSSGTSVQGGFESYSIFLKSFSEGGIMISFKTSSVPSSGWYGGFVGSEKGGK